MMASLSKNQKENLSKIKEGSKYKISDALALVKECATAKFDESVDVSINLGIDTKKSDQTVRGAVVLPNGTGKVVRVAVFTQGDNVQKASDAGADVVLSFPQAGEIDIGVSATPCPQCDCFDCVSTRRLAVATCALRRRVGSTDVVDEDVQPMVAAARAVGQVASAQRVACMAWGGSQAARVPLAAQPRGFLVADREFHAV